MKDPYKPPPRSEGLTIRMRPENMEALRAKAYSEGMLLTEWARGVLLRELDPNNGK